MSEPSKCSSPCRRAERRRVDHGFDGGFLLLFLRQVLPDRADRRACAALVEQHRDHGELAVAALVHQVGDHGVRLAVDLLFARLVEVELHELVARPADVDPAARRVVHLDRVAVVDQLERRGLVVELDRRQVRRLGAADVDRRLDLAELAGGERLIEFSPLRGSAMPP